MLSRRGGGSVVILVALLAGCEIPSGQPSADSLKASTPAPWYEAEIRAFEASDAARRPAPGQVLFVGSSTIRMWKTLGPDMSPAPILNRGFGGSKTRDVLAVFERIVKPYTPRVIVYYCGDNDLGTENTDAAGAADGFIEFNRRVRALWPGVRVIYIAIKPSIARWSNWDAMRRANELVRRHCEGTPGSVFVDTATPTLGPDATPDPSLFEADGLHLNAKGYRVWASVVRPAVLKAWDDVKDK